MLTNRFFSKNNKSKYAPLIRGNGVRVWDVNNKEYIDFASQTLNLNLGHCHPRIIKVAKEQINKLYFSSSRFLDVNSLKLSRILCKLSHIPNARINLRLNGGTEANEDAIKRIRAYHGSKNKIITFKDSMLGVSIFTQAGSGKYSDLPFDISKLRKNFIFIKRPLH